MQISMILSVSGLFRILNLGLRSLDAIAFQSGSVSAASESAGNSAALTRRSAAGEGFSFAYPHPQLLLCRFSDIINQPTS